MAVRPGTAAFHLPNSLTTPHRLAHFSQELGQLFVVQPLQDPQPHVVAKLESRHIENVLDQACQFSFM
jgi:hypothetical protein